MELNWKEDNNLVRKIAKILLGDTPQWRACKFIGFS